MRTLLFLLVVVALGFLSQLQPAEGCAIPWRPNQPVSIDSEDAVILWEPSTKTEHFIRRAQFKTQAKDFGFLVPTPTEPKLAEVEDSIFEVLVQTTKARVIYEKRVRRMPRDAGNKVIAGAVKSAAPAPMAPQVEVLNKQQVAGYDAVVLKANNPEALQKWLERHGYDARPTLIEWFKWYTENNWIITAFKLSNDGSLAQRIAGRTVRLTFQTETPFYPYREPADMRTNSQPNGQRLLKVFFLSDKRYDGTIGTADKWPGHPVWANALPEVRANGVFDGMGLQADEKKALTAKKWHLTEFEDRSFPRPGTDEVYFRVASSQATLERPPIIVYNDVIEYYDPPISEPVEEAIESSPGIRVLLGVFAITILGAAVIAWLLLRNHGTSTDTQ